MLKQLHLFLFVFLLPFAGAMAQEGNISGTVKYDETGGPVQGANVLLYQKTKASSEVYKATTTDNDGNFEFKGLGYDGYSLHISYMGYSKVRKEFSLQQNNLHIEVFIKAQPFDLGEVTVSSLHQQKRIKHVSMPIEVMQNTEANRIASFSPAEALQSEPGIELKDDGAWATSINIRGMNEKRFVTLVDGNRIETATDIAAGLSMIDITEIERVEIIKGAASSLYGTGAMGGVVNFISKKGQFRDKPYINGALLSEFQSVNDLFSQKLAITGGNDFGYFRISGRMRNANDLETPEGIIPNSQFKDHNVAVDFGFKPKENHKLELQYQRFSAEDVGIPGGAPFPGPAEATYKSAKRNLFSVNYTISDITESWQSLSFKYFHQNVLRDVLMYPNVPPQQDGTSLVQPQKITPTGNHYTNGAEVKGNWQFNENHGLIAGIDIWQRKLKTEREKFIRKEVFATDSLVNPVDTIDLVRGETPIPESEYTSGGIFFQDEVMLFDSLIQVSFGGRYDLIHVHNKKTLDPTYLKMNGSLVEPPPNQRITFSEQSVINQSWSTNLGLLFNATNDLDFTLTLGRSFRSPSLEERYKFIDLGNKVRVGDPNLEPESGYSVDVGFRLWKNDLNIRANLFLNKFSDLIVEKNSQYVYEYTTGPEAGTTDTLPALINSNVDKSRLYGFDMKLEYKLFENAVLHGMIAYVRGEEIKNNANLPLIPPLNGRVGFKYHVPDLLTLDLTSVMYDKQDKVAEGETATDGYTLFDLSVYSEPISFNGGNMKFIGGVENIFDKAYQNHLSTNRGVIDYQPGRNFFVKMQIQF
jgi:hemoglobin/transferrin/lactoferrin receptor protein